MLMKVQMQVKLKIMFKGSTQMLSKNMKSRSVELLFHENAMFLASDVFSQHMHNCNNACMSQIRDRWHREFDIQGHHQLSFQTKAPSDKLWPRLL